MMEVLLLLCACFCVGLSYDELVYGSSFTLTLHRKAQSLTFTPRFDESNVMILWKRYGPSDNQDSRRKVTGSYYVINPSTQEDSGTYTLRDKDQLALSVRTIRVVARQMSFQNTAGESFNFAFDLEPTSCHIYFFPETDRVEQQIVHHGRLLPNPECPGIGMSGQCGVSNLNPKKSCSGRYEVRDSKGNRALVATVKVKVSASTYDTKKIGLGVGIFLAVVSCCGCLKRCCCGKSSSKEEQPETPDEEPAVHYHDYDHEPVGPRLEQPYPAQPSHTPTGPLINNPPTTVPTAYSVVFPAPAEPTVGPTVPVESDGELRFELKGTSFSSAPPLSSDSPYSDVYTSDKLNFL